jgi:hypothetical protein
VAPPRIVEGADFGSKRASITTVTVRAGEQCAALSAASTPDTSCSAWKEALEQALVAGGIQVVPWPSFRAALEEKRENERMHVLQGHIDSLRQTMAVARPPEPPRRGAAAERNEPAAVVPSSAQHAAEPAPGDPRLAVQAILEIEAGSVGRRMGTPVEELQFFSAAADGHPEGPALLPHRLEERLREFVRPRVRGERHEPPAFIEAQLDVSAMSPDEVQLLWSYHRSEVKKVRRDEVVHFLFATAGDKFGPLPPPGASRSGGDAEGAPPPEPPQRESADIGQAAGDLMRRLADDAVGRLHGRT